MEEKGGTVSTRTVLQAVSLDGITQGVSADRDPRLGHSFIHQIQKQHLFRAGHWGYHSK